MGMTMAEKILKRASGKSHIKAGDYVNANVDLAFIIEGAPIFEILKEANVNRVWDASKVISVIDHAIPPPNKYFAEQYKIVREMLREFDISTAYGERAGICHQIIVEKGHVIPGILILGNDSHTTTYGAIGAAGAGIGYTEMAYLLKKGSIWLKVPQTIKFNLIGKLKHMVMSKDIFLYIAGEYSSEVAQYKAVEFTGDGAHELSIASRMTMSNMGVEIGAKFAFFEADEKTLEFLREKNNLSLKTFKADPDASYEKEFNIDVSSLEPQVAFPHKVDNVKPISEVEEIKIDQAFLGSCTNSRFEDLEIAANILKNRKVHPSVRMVIIPASWEIYSETMHKGLIDIFINAGALIGPPGCGPCCGNHLGILGSGERCIGSHNRNFKGRMGSNKAEIYLGSPATVAASALEGKIADPRTYI
ncbi:MAG: 3-isopropylmalate dehydratase large subunit [Atribacterota bacterium]|nr:3-isopropylmalate dehydratase large subunit [Atribacterota bacterium]